MTEINKPAAPDWERIEELYRAGVLSVREIAADQGVSHTAIQKRAKSHAWERDLGAKIKAKADSLVARREVATQVATETATSKVATERVIVEANAEVIAGIRLAHRSDLRRARTLTMGLLAELEAQSVDRQLFEQLGELLDGAEGEGGAIVPDKMLDLFRAVTSLPGRTKTMKDLAESLQKLIGMERDAYSIGDPKKIEVTMPGAGTLSADPVEAAQTYQAVMSG
ncbi:hypothetical protein [Lysobacter sp. GCM10012299]|uniref:hypothetical protein n=1 Tax=Lysobacter sp. GCM10012299 TaxID=3317333 RepID=UPI00360E8428